MHANDPRYYSGSIETLVEMTVRASRVIRAVDPRAVLVRPSMGQWWTTAGQETLRRFAELGGYDHCDVAGVNLHQRHAADPPETMAGLFDQVYDTLHAVGVNPLFWNTDTTYDFAREESLDEQQATDYAMRFYLIMVYGTDFGLQRAYFYNWGGTRLPIALQPVGGQPTRAALAVEELQRWLAHTRTSACGHGLAAGLPDNVWQCKFTSEEQRLLVVRWTDTGTALTTADPGAEELWQVGGASSPLRAGDTVQVSGTPQLIVHRHHS